MKNTVQGGWKKPGNSGVNINKMYTGSVPSATRATKISGMGNIYSPRGTIASSKLDPMKSLGDKNK